GLALYGGIIPYTGTFLTFSDYARNAVRLSALMQLQHILIYSHDSIGLGEDGPTHQPIEHIASLRLIPGLHVWRPADSVETAVAWQHSLEHREGPSCLLLSRQDLPVFRRDEEIIKQIIRGGYILRDSDPKKPIEAIIMATGSEVSLAIEAQIILEEAHGINTRVVSMPCVEVFVKQSKEYQEQVLPKSIKKRLAIEAGVPNTWHRFVGDQGSVVGIERFGESAPAPEVFNALGITAEAIVKAVCELSKNNAVLI
ncbi:MAG: transketolase, partial [Gammaproteobacteria bacterium]|nr:transketolase [Gammaproteobacteria bacterium]